MPVFSPSGSSFAEAGPIPVLVDCQSGDAASSAYSSVAYVGRRSIGGAASKPVFGCFAVVIGGGGLPDECGPVIETVDVDYCAGASRSIAHGADLNTAAPANQKVGGRPRRACAR